MQTVSVPASEDGIAIAEFAAVVDFDRNARQALDHEFAGEGGVPTGAAGDDAHALEFANACGSIMPFRRGRLCRYPARCGRAWCRARRGAAQKFP